MKGKLISLIAIIIMFVTTSKAQTITKFISTGIFHPNALAFDDSGNLFVADYFSISKVTPSGTVTTFVGLSCKALAFDKAGNLFVADYNNSISKITPSGMVTTFVSSGLNSPTALAFDNTGNLFVANYNNSSISKITQSGVITTFVNSGLSGPSALAFDKAGNLFVANSNSTISKVTTSGVVTKFVDSGIHYYYTDALAFDKAGNLFVSNYSNVTINKVTPSGTVTTFVPNIGDSTTALAFDTTGNLFAANQGNSIVYKISFNNLPVILSSFTANTNNIIIQTNWQTTSEINTSHFIIQHSTGGKSFKEIGRLNAIGSEANSYQFIDNKPANGINYYRLQSVDKDGSSSYSKVVSVIFGENQSFSIIPNPARDFATISFNKTVEKATIAVYDITGKAVIIQSLNETKSYKLNTQTLTNGVYVIKVNTATGSYNEKLLINK